MIFHLSGKSSAKTGRATIVRITASITAAGLILMSTPGHSAPPNPRVIQRYKEMLQANPVEGTALERLWNAFVEQGKTAELLEEYAQKRDFGSQMVFGHLLRRSGKADLATAAFQRASELDEKSPLPFLALGSLCEAEGLPRQAAEWSAKAVARIAPNDPRYVETLMELGTRWLAAGDLEQAAAAWEKTAGLDPENLAIRRRLAETYLRHQVNLPGAVTHFEYLTRHASPAERATAFQQLARLHESAGKTDAAVAALESGLALTAPGNWLRAELQSQLIRLHQRHHLLDQLEVRWKEWAAANPRDAGGLSQLVELYERTGDLEQKKVWLEKLVALTPKNIAQRLRLARLHVQLDEIDAAAALFDRLLVELPRDPDIILERARLDVQQGAAGNARKRIRALLSARPDDETVRPRALEFFEIHRLHDAAEALLTTDAASGREEAVLDLARFYFAQRRDADAHRTLARLVRPTAAREEQAAAHLRIAQTLKIRGDIENAAVSARAAVALAEESREAQLVLGELAAAAGRNSEARAAFEKAYALGKTAAEALEADQKLFDALRNPSAGLGESPATVPISGSLRTDDGQSISTPALQDLLLALTRAAAANPSVERWLRIARWNLWSRNPRVAQECTQQALTLDAGSVEAHEFMVKLALADPQPQKAIGHLRELTKLNPENGDAYQRRIAQIEMQTGRAEEALRIFRELAAANPGNLDALNDLALAQQRSEQWEAALSTCRQILASSPPSRKKEAIAQLQRVYDRLRMPQEAAALLLQQIDAQEDEGERFTLFRDLLTHCMKHQQLDWLRVELERRRRIRIDDYFLNVALGRTLKAAGDKAAAFTVIADAALSAPNPSETLPELVREAEDLRKLDAAVQLQAQLVRILPHPPAAAFEKLAQLQERNFAIETAARTWAKITGKFPRDAGVLERAADFELKWGTPGRALELLRKTRELEPGNLRALSALAELEIEFGAARNAEKHFEEILQIAPREKTAAIRFPAWRGEDPGRLQTSYLDTVRLRRGKPNSEAMRALRSFWVSGDGRVNSDSDLRLSAVRNLATLIEARGAGAQREQWIQRWRATSNAPSETLCALYYSGAHEALLDHLEAMMRRRESEPQTKQAFLWLALQTRAFARLSDWLRDPRRSASDRDFLLVALAQHLSSNGGQVDSALIQRLFPPGFRLRIWQAAQMFANRGQFREAAQLGQRVFDALSTQRAAYGVDLATWYLYIGEVDSARTVLHASITSRGEAFDAPVYSALRQYWFLLPEPERAAFADRFLAGLDDHAEPLHAAICRTLLHGLAGRERIAQEQLRRVLDLGAMSHLSFDEPGTSASRVWEFILTAGAQLQSWKLDSLAVFLWENALADPAFIRLQAEAQGEQVQTRANEVRTRLAAAKIARADSFDRAAILEEYRRFAPRDGMVSLAEALESAGAFQRSIEICRQLWEAEPANPQALRNMLNACRTAGDLQTLEMVLRRCTSEGLFRVTESGHRDLTLQLVEILEQRNAFSEARDILEETLRPPQGSGERSSPADHRLALRLAQLHERTGDIARAEQIYQQLLAREPGNTSARIALATLLTQRDAENEAVALLEKGAGVEVEGRLAAIYLKSGRLHDAIASLERLPIGAHIPATLQAASILSERGQRTEALLILRNAVARTADSAAAFPLQSKIVELLHDTEDPSRIAREWRRLREMAGDDRNSMSAYFDLLVRHARRLRRVAEARDELTASWNGGRGSLAAGVAAVEWALINDDRAASDELARQLLQRQDLNENIAQKLAALAVRYGRTDLLINAQARLARVNPIDFSKIITWAETLHQHGKRADAIAALAELTWRAALNDEIAARVAETFLKFGEVAKARSLFEQAIVADHVGRNYRAHLGFARLSLSEGDHANAKKMLRIAFQHPANREMADLLNYLEKTGQLEDAERALRDIGLDETRAVLLRQALFAHWIKEAKLPPLLKLIGEHPQILDAARLVELRALTKKTEGFEGATQHLEALRLESASALPELNRELALLYLDWAENRLRQLDVEGAIDHLGRGRELAPANFALARRLSELLVERGQRSRAAETLEHFIAASNNRAEQETARQLLAKIRSN